MTWNMSHRIFGWQKLFFINFVQNYSHTRFSNDSESQTRQSSSIFPEGRGVCIHRVESDKSRYFAITEFSNCFIIWSTCISLGSKQSDLPFSGKEKSVGSFMYEQNIICSQTPKPNTWTMLRMSRPLFVGSYLQVTWWARGQWKERKICLKWC